MLFNSIEFIFFLPAVVAVYFLLPHTCRKFFLLGASYYFYMSWKVEYVLLIAISTSVDYLAAIQLERAKNLRVKRWWLVLSLCSNLGILFGFKYFNFAGETLNALFAWIDLSVAVPWFDVLLPVGISFYTFQTLSYTIDVYRGERKAERDFTTFALFVSFFPQLVAGPIERSSRLLPQFKQVQTFNYRNMVDGLMLIFWGLFKKVVIADRVAVFVNAIYNHPGEFEGVPVWLATYLFAFQIYCDFSGYSDIARGSAQLMGYRLMVNFKQPYFAESVGEFWKRWHISLSTWFRDYLYIPLGGNRVVQWRWYANLMAVFLISGLWHGANWTFLFWGGLHGLFLVCGIGMAPLREWVGRFTAIKRSAWLLRGFQVFITFHLVCFAWIFFRANSLADAMTLVNALPKLHLSQFSGLGDYGLSTLDLAIAGAAICLLETVHLVQRYIPVRRTIARQPWIIRWAIYYGLIMVVVLLGDFSSKQQFIYFQF